MADRMKVIWRKATETQKAAWIERRNLSFGNSLLNTSLLDVICSFESRWILQEHCACPICWEGGKSMVSTGLPDFVSHMKKAHKIGWKNVKDFSCMTFSKALCHAAYREGLTKKGGQRIEISNPYAWSPYPGCRHSHEKGTTFRKHFDKCHESKSVPSMVIWALIAQLIKRDQDVRICDMLGKTGGWTCSQCGHFGPTLRFIRDHISAKHRAEQGAQGTDCDIEPAVKQGFGKSEDPNLSRILQEAIDKSKAPRLDHWTKEDAEAYGRDWDR
jgi:hypothetical protein